MTTINNAKLSDFYWVPNITQKERDSHTAQPRIANFLNVLKRMYKLPTFGDNTRWLCTSIDTSWVDSAPRYPKDEHHRDQKGGDWIAVNFTEKGTFNVNIQLPYNRNLLLSHAILSMIDELGYDMHQMPFIAMEADHIHTDVFRPGALILYNEVRTPVESADMRLIPFLPTLNNRSFTKMR